ncbi:MAG: hypothetical protein ONB14_12375 [candidate division KSB1 bacterium]|nr:hypothetical protein [candidate division KSB1 bacterium]
MRVTHVPLLATVRVRQKLAGQFDIRDELVPAVRDHLVLLAMAAPVAACGGGQPEASLTTTATATATPGIPLAIPSRSAGAGTIIENGQAPFSAMEYLFENRWEEKRADGTRVVVYAGVQGSALDPSRTQGVAVVVVLGADGNPIAGESGRYPTPTKAGPVRVTDAIDRVLTLTADNGTTFRFDVSSRAYLP